MIPMHKKIKICFVCIYCYPLFNPEHRIMFGGWEVRIAQIARRLAGKAEYSVSIIIADSAQPHIEFREGIQFITWAGKPFWGIPTEENKSSISEIAKHKEPEITQNALAQSVVVKSPEENSNTDISILKIEPEKEKQPIEMERKNNYIELASIIRRVYKSVIPWRLRILITGFLAGTKAGFIQFYRNWKVALHLAIDGIKSGINGVRISWFTFLDHFRPSVTVAINAIGHIDDRPVYKDMVSIYEEADAHIYVVPGNSFISAEAVWSCKKRKRSFVMLAGSDIDFSPVIRENPEGSDLYGSLYSDKLYTIKNADIHIVQNERQFEMARTYGCSPIMIQNPVDLKRVHPKETDPKMILWVGNSFESVKQPNLMINAIRELPEYSFIMIVTPVTDEQMEIIYQHARTVPNLNVLTRIPYNEIEKYFAQARLFVNSSSFEGFPNTFLQAGKYGVPLISLNIDPNRMLTKYRCGLFCDNQFELMVHNIRLVMEDQALYDSLSANIIDYVQTFHDIDKIIPEYERAFLSALDKKVAKHIV